VTPEQRDAWRNRAWTAALAAAGVLLLSGALAAIYYRPYGHRAPARIGLAVAVASGARAIHLVAAGALVLALVAVAVVRLWRGPRRAGGVLVGTMTAGVAAAFIATGLVTPWQALVPWAVPQGANMARPMPLLGHDGPFPELVGVNVTYDDAVLALGRLRLGPRGVGRLYLAHTIFLPVAAIAGALATRRRWRRAPAVHPRIRNRPPGPAPSPDLPSAPPS
jgi:hypothetical protein